MEKTDKGLVSPPREAQDLAGAATRCSHGGDGRRRRLRTAIRLFSLHAKPAVFVVVNSTPYLEGAPSYVLATGLFGLWEVSGGFGPFPCLDITVG